MESDGKDGVSVGRQPEVQGYTRPVDMRKSFRGLAGIVHSEIGRQLSPEDVYVFVGKNRRTRKLLHRECHGLTLYTRKLDGVCFPKIEVDEEKNECVISYATFIKMAIGERSWGKMGVYICWSL